jgi:amino acid transporter
MSDPRTTAAGGPAASAGEGAPGVEAFGYRQELKRSLSFTDLLVYGLVFMVPIAPFGIFGSVFSGSGGMIALAYAIGMLAMAFTAASYSQMSRAFPMAGSVYTYAGRGIAQPVGFLAGWMILLDYVLVPGLLYLIAGVAMNSILSGIPVWLWVAAFVVLNTVVNYLGIEFTARINKIMLLAELVVLAIFLVIGLVALASGKSTDSALHPIYNSDTFSFGLVFGAVSIAVLSFLGFDGISTLAEESTGRKNPAGRAMIIALFVVAFLFVAQTWLASLLAGGREAFSDDEVGNAFFTLVQAASNTGWMNAFFAVNVMAVGFANAMAAQAATSRLLYSMSRDGQLPSFLSKISSRKVPMAAILVVSALSLVLVLFFVGQISLISSLVNFGALFGFCLLHVSVVWYYMVRKKSRNYLLHLVVPTLGFLIIGYVLFNADVLAKVGGLVWLVVGAVVFAVNVFRGKGVPELTEDRGSD